MEEMMGKIRSNRFIRMFIGVALVYLLSAACAYAADQETLDRLEKIIKQQQAQIEAQQKTLEQLQGELESLKGRVAAPAEKTDKAVSQAPATVKTGNPKANLKLYGQVNKAVLFSNDGDDSNTYLVDNDNSSTRVGLAGSIKPNDHYEIGTLIEVEYQTNPSNLVNQDDKRISNTDFEKRHLDLYVDTSKFGKLSLGWGSAASENAAEVDLSGTSVVGYSSIPDMAGGQLFYDEDTDSLSNTAIRNVFGNWDGLGRDERIRYDTPALMGLVASTSYVTDGGGDFALRYNAKIATFKLAAAAAYADPGSTSDNIDDQLAGSVSLLHDSGFNGTFALGNRNNKQSGRDDSSFYYAKFGYRANWCPLGVTSLAVDYGRFSDVNLDGDDADAIGLQMVQDFRDWGSEFYLGYRFHKLDRKGADYDNINAVMSGMRVKF